MKWLSICTCLYPCVICIPITSPACQPSSESKIASITVWAAGLALVTVAAHVAKIGYNSFKDRDYYKKICLAHQLKAQTIRTETSNQFNVLHDKNLRDTSIVSYCFMCGVNTVWMYCLYKDSKNFYDVKISDLIWGKQDKEKYSYKPHSSPDQIIPLDGVIQRAQQKLKENNEEFFNLIQDKLIQKQEPSLIKRYTQFWNFDR